MESANPKHSGSSDELAAGTSCHSESMTTATMLIKPYSTNFKVLRCTVKDMEVHIFVVELAPRLLTVLFLGPHLLPHFLRYKKRLKKAFLCCATTSEEREPQGVSL